LVFNGWNTEVAKPVQPSKQAPAPAKPGLTPKEQLAKSIAQDQLGEYLDVEVKDGMLVITANNKRPSMFNIFTDLSIARRMSTIKSVLGLKDGTIGTYNPDVYNRFSFSIQRGYSSTPDDGVLAEGSSISIPVSALGEDPNIWQWLRSTFDDLKK